MDVHDQLMMGAEWAQEGMQSVCGGVSVKGDMPQHDTCMHSSNAQSVLSTLGIEAARQCIVNDLKSCVGNVNVRHLLLIADCMTHHGNVSPMARSHVRQMDPTAVLGMASFETACDVMSRSARAKVIDPIKSVSSCISMGQMPCIGTESFGIIETFTPAPSGGAAACDIVELLNRPVDRKRSFKQLIGGT